MGLLGSSMRPALMNHSEPALVDTPTRRAAAAPFRPPLRNSKYVFGTDSGSLFAPPRDMGRLLSGVATTDGNRRVYPVVFIDAINVKIRDGQVANRPIYVALAVTAEGHRDILGLWAGHGGEGAKHWLRVLSELKNRGVEDVLMLVCDGLKGLPDAVGEVWPRTVVQTCVVHLLRASFRYAARQDWDKIAKALKPIYTAPTEDAATTRFLEFAETWGKKYPAIVRLWESSWPEFTPFLQFDAEMRRIVCTTNSIESVNARIRKAVRSRGHFPTEQAALKCVYMAVMSLDPTGAGRKRWTMRWKGAMNAFDLAFDGRLTAGQL